MEVGRETQRPLGVVLVEQGLVTGDDIDGALAAQAETSQPLGEILLQRSLIARPMLAKALAAQRGRSLEEEGGFGSGLMAKIEQLHLLRRGLQDEKLRERDSACTRRGGRRSSGVGGARGSSARSAAAARGGARCPRTRASTAGGSASAQGAQAEGQGGRRGADDAGRVRGRSGARPKGAGAQLHCAP